MDVWRLVFRFLPLKDLLGLRLVSSSFRAALLNDVAFSRHFALSRGDIAPESQALSPLHRKLLVFERQQSCLSNLRGKRISYVFVESAEPVRACVIVGMHFIAVSATSWWIGLLETGKSIPHLVESLCAPSGQFPFVVLRDKFLAFSLGGIVYGLDCGEALEVCNILCRADPPNERLLSDGVQSVAYCGASLTTVFDWTEHPPFGWHHERAFETGLQCRALLPSRRIVCETSEGRLVVVDQEGVKEDYIEQPSLDFKADDVISFDLQEGGNLWVSAKNEDGFCAATGIEKILHVGKGRAAVQLKESGAVHIVSLV
jgi:hypothetical protein